MSGTVNKVILIGHLGRDPEIRAAQDGKRVATLSIATSESWRDKSSGERKEKTEWHRITVFNEHLVEVAEKYARKSSKVFVEGQLQTRKWTDRGGVERYTTDVVLAAYRGELQLPTSNGEGGSRPPPADSPDDYGSTSTRPAAGSGGDLNDEIPFATSDASREPHLYRKTVAIA